MIDNRKYEKKYHKYQFIAGVDEAGRGPLVGPVVAAAVILKKDYYNKELNDSKKLSKKKREELYDLIKKDALAVGVGIVDNKVIDKINILEASRLAMKKAINDLEIVPDVVLTDQVHLGLDLIEENIIKGDQLSITISAASIIAKVERDRIMLELDRLYPEYNYKNNNGYPTKEHLEKIKEYGINEYYRKSYKPVQRVIKEEL